MQFRHSTTAAVALTVALAAISLAASRTSPALSQSLQVYLPYGSRDYPTGQCRGVMTRASALEEALSIARATDLRPVAPHREIYSVCIQLRTAEQHNARASEAVPRLHEAEPHWCVYYVMLKGLGLVHPRVGRTSQPMVFNYVHVVLDATHGQPHAWSISDARPLHVAMHAPLALNLR